MELDNFSALTSMSLHLSLPRSRPLSRQVKEVHSSANWRRSTMTHSDVIHRIVQQGYQLSPLLEAPWVHTGIFRMDWLHVCDLGVAADFLGNFFNYILSLLPGTTRRTRCAALFELPRLAAI